MRQDNLNPSRTASPYCNHTNPVRNLIHFGNNSRRKTLISHHIPASDCINWHSQAPSAVCKIDTTEEMQQQQQKTTFQQTTKDNQPSWVQQNNNTQHLSPSLMATARPSLRSSQPSQHVRTTHREDRSRAGGTKTKVSAATLFAASAFIRCHDRKIACLCMCVWVNVCCLVTFFGWRFYVD